MDRSERMKLRREKKRMMKSEENASMDIAAVRNTEDLEQDPVISAARDTIDILRAIKDELSSLNSKIEKMEKRDEVRFGA